VTTYQTDLSKRQEGSADNWNRWFILTSGGILLIAGLAKIFSTLGRQEILNMTDPVFGITFRYLMLSVGLLEVLCSAACFLFANKFFSVGFVAWLATCFFLYRLGLWCSGWQSPCPCLGEFTDAIHLSARNANLIASTFLIYMLLGSYGLLSSKYLVLAFRKSNI
jgi:hypothetical protein